MNDSARYQRAQKMRHDGDVVTSRGVDAVTGLPVHIYDFPGPPRVKPGQIDSEGVLTVLAAGYDGADGVLVTALQADAVPLADTTVDDGIVLQALRTLRDAARIGLVHGDITPERFQVAHGRLYLEGYGVPWSPETMTGTGKEAIRAALARDLVSTTKALLSFGSAGMSGEVAAALKGALGSATRSGDAGQLYTVVRRLAGGAVTVPPSGFSELTLPATAERSPRPEVDALSGIELASPAGSAEPASAAGAGAAGGAEDDDPLTRLDYSPAALFDEGAPEPPLDAEGARPPGQARPVTPLPEDPDPITLHSDPGDTLRIDQRTTSSGGGFVKDLPPGATYRAGDPEEDVRVPPIDLEVNAVPSPHRQGWRVPLLLVTLLAVAGAAAYLALLARGDAPSDLVGGGTVSHLVDVRVDPPNLPPASLVVEQRPPGSAYRSGTIIASVPRRVGFDAEGVWVVHASIQGRVSESVTLNVPQDNAITIVFPPEEAP